MIIAFAGSLYARDEWNALLGALDARSWKIAGREVIVRVLGSHIDQTGSRPVRMEFFGWRDPAETVRLLAEATIGYVPYFLDPRCREAVELSFPGKLATYIAARLPIFFHGPRSSSPMRFMDRYPVGIGCDSLEPEAIAGALERLVADRAFHERAALACDAAYEEELSHRVFRRRFAELVGIDESELLPPHEPETRAGRMP